MYLNDWIWNWSGILNLLCKWKDPYTHCDVSLLLDLVNELFLKYDFFECCVHAVCLGFSGHISGKLKFPMHAMQNSMKQPQLAWDLGTQQFLDDRNRWMILWKWFYKSMLSEWLQLWETGVPWHWSTAQMSHTSKFAAAVEDETCSGDHILGFFPICMPVKFKIRVLKSWNC